MCGRALGRLITQPGLYPPGILIGTVSRAFSEAGSVESFVTIRPAVDFSTLEKPGTYTFGFESNDGVRLEIGDYMVVEDPDVHADRSSDLGMIQANAPGWYPLTIRYYERKNTWTIRFYWLPPGGEPGSLPLVPAEVLAHVEQPPA